ncbi:PDR/VanB family oxidoreductase [Arthrobacter pullicola]|uniref:PDR/VanB family oxidoreductase n=1 Tax=Arthrobacter pullicola TaxID=2762224 RepID=UPI00296A921C|nr:PDR/VanB family oxidoreductase [Arthrobacter pullicola]
MNHAAAAGYRRPLPLRQGFTLVVQSTRDEAPGVRSLALASPDGSPLPEFVPGSHLLVECGNKVNAYSLTASGTVPSAYTITVLLQDDGGGGSRFLHGLHPGDRVRVSRPRNGFSPQATATRHLLIAGGIGVTPVLSHARAAAMWRQPFSVLYGYRHRIAPHVQELRELCGGRLIECPDRPVFVRQLSAALTHQPLGTHLYVCGGTSFVESVIGAARGFGWPEERLHREVFDNAVLEPGQPFTVHLERSGRTVPVPAGMSLLEALEDEGLEIPNLCRQGVCGECRLTVTSGVPLHRDSYLPAAARSSNSVIMPCVSRAAGERIGVDL